jgi:hypothetical protein
MEWNKESPHAWEEGNWDGKRTDRLLVLTKNRNIKIATCYIGFMDGSDFKEWYSDDDYLINEEVIGWMPLPEIT